MKHHWSVESNSYCYIYQCRKCFITHPYPALTHELPQDGCAGAPCLCSYKQIPNVCTLHGASRETKEQQP